MVISRRTILAMAAGFGVTVGIGLINNIIPVLLYIRATTHSPGNMPAIYTILNNNLGIFVFLSQIIGMLTPLLGGTVVGFIAKEKGAIYGSVLALFIDLLSLAINALAFFMPDHTPNHAQADLAMQNIHAYAYVIPTSMAIMGLGGFLGEKIAQKSVLRIKKG